MACFLEDPVVKEKHREFGQDYARVIEEGGHKDYPRPLEKIVPGEGCSMATEAEGDPPVYEASFDDDEWLLCD